jgi:hypothetical protein
MYVGLSKSLKLFRTPERAWFPLFLVALLIGATACGSQVESPPPSQEKDPMELQRVFSPPNGIIQLSPAVRLVDPHKDNEDRVPLVLASNVYQMPDVDISAATIDEDTVTVPIANRKHLLERKAGDIVLSDKDEFYWRRIRNVAVKDGHVHWETEPANFNQVVQHGEFYLQVDLSKGHPGGDLGVDLADVYRNPEALEERAAETRRGALSNCPQAPECLENPLCDDDGCPADSPRYLCPTNGLVLTQGAPYTLQEIAAHQDAEGLDNDESPFSCEPIDGRQLCVLEACQSDDDCAFEGDFCRLDGWQDGSCKPAGEQCDTNGDCCTGDCDTTQCDREDGNCDYGICNKSDTGFCIQACEDSSNEYGANDPGVQADINGDDGGLLKKLFDVVLGEFDWFGVNFDKTKLKFTPNIEFGIKVEWFKVKNIKLILQADWEVGVGMIFDLPSADVEYSFSKEKRITLFTFAILGYPFSVDMLLHGRAQFRASAGGKLEPSFSYFTTVEVDGETKKGVEVSDDYGFQYGIIYQGSGDACDEYPSEEDYKCSNDGNIFYVQRFKDDTQFDPGIEANLDLSGLAEVGARIILRDRGAMQTDLIGLEPLNLFSRAYATIQEPFCGVGFKLIYRMFLTVGPISFWGLDLIEQTIGIPIFSTDLVNKDWILPDDLDLECDGEDQDHGVCIVLETLGCGVTPAEFDPGPIEQCAHDPSVCADNQRCVGDACVSQPADSLRVSLSWNDRTNLNLQIVGPNGPVSRDSFTATCAGPDACDENSFVENAILTDLTPGEYRISVSNTAAQNVTALLDHVPFEVEVEHEGQNQQGFSGTVPKAGGSGPGTTQAPLIYMYVVE